MKKPLICIVENLLINKGMIFLVYEKCLIIAGKWYPEIMVKKYPDMIEVF